MREMKILFVEDDVVLNLATSVALEDEGVDMKCVYSGPAAIEAITSLEYLDALLTDIDLGKGPDGFDVARYARKLYPHLPVVFVSGTMGLHHAANGVEGSVFVAKPFHPAQLMRALDQAIHREAA
ncbi:MAG TPA: response regulator [Phenylobacterium sp.]|jgi:CheY-like chemotaxis protein|nr:response regulator [Phenylobacterium sp.]